MSEYGIRKIILIMYCLGALSMGIFANKIDTLRCKEDVPVAYVMMGVAWPILGVMASVMYLFGFDFMENRCEES